METHMELADACPECPPGDHPASLPLSVAPDSGDSLKATYQCTEGHRWDCWWDRNAAEWPVIGRAAA
jgi:hypothetical protein